MDVVGGHLVHAPELVQGRVHDGERELCAGATRVRVAWRRPFPVGEHRLEALPVGERPERRVGGDEVVQVGGAGAGQSTDHDGRHDRLIEDLGVTHDQVLDQEAVAEEPGEELRLGEQPGMVEPCLLPQRTAEDLEPAAEVVGPEVVEAGLGHGRVDERIRFEGDGPPRLGHEVEDGSCLVAVPGLGQIVDGDRRRASRRAHPPAGTGTTTASGCAGVSAGRNHRNQIHPLWWPAVETQLGCPGSVGEMTISHEPSSS